MPQVLCQRWEESERSWGIRPDGYSLHLNEIQRQQYVKIYWERMPDQTPDCYSRPTGTIYPIEVDWTTYLNLCRPGYGLRYYGTAAELGSPGRQLWEKRDKQTSLATLEEINKQLDNIRISLENLGQQL